MTNPYKQSYHESTIENVNLAVFNCGLQSCTPNHSWGPGVRDHFLIHFVLRGCGKYICNGVEYTLKAGDMFFIKPSQLVHYIADEKDPWEYYWVGFNGTYAQRLVTNLPFSDAKPFYTPKNGEICSDYLYNIYSNSGHEIYNNAAMTGYLYLFLSKLMEENSMLSPARTSSQSSYVIDAIKYIQFNYSNDIRVDDIANSVGISRSHLYRVFMSTLGTSPIDYLTEYRINEACTLLRETNLSISQIATSVGFFDKFYFSKVFKKIKGIPPSKYVQNLEVSSEK